MNLFILSKNPSKNVQYHCDKHVVKMILEYAQMLCTAHRVLDDDRCDDILYKKTHTNHPCTRWVRHNDKNYIYTYTIFKLLCHEYTFRYGKIHLTETKLLDLLSIPPCNIKTRHSITKFAQAMPDDYKHTKAVIAYRLYYNKDKSHIHSWTKRDIPYWIKK